MSKNEKETSTTLKRSWTQELKSEFGKIKWLDRKTLAKQSVLLPNAQASISQE